MEYFTFETSIRSFSLVTLDRHRTLLNQPQMSASTEYDIAFKIWVPLIDCLFGGQPPIVTKIAETTNDYSSHMKKRQYPDSNVISFKIDFRILYHHHHHHRGHQSIDLAAGEAAKNIDEMKLKMDHGKLAREAKDILDRLALINIDGNYYAWKGTAIQLAGKWVENSKNGDGDGYMILTVLFLSFDIIGLQGEISSIHLHDSGLYVLLPESRLSFPQSHVSLHRFLPTMKALLQLRVRRG
ncbi:hypothetical protein [Absidia glauca]|uniref:Uncharacterized protein n=1 Tax=Absidia glauca TaxID=4829 RepID=A0A168PRP0_ABSGL|nr:hypothetical protein [Absidia glauca]